MNCFGCLYVWMFGPGRVPPHTTERKASPNGLQEYVFMEVLAGYRFEVFAVHPSIHPYIRMDVETYSFYECFVKPWVFMMVS